MKKKLSVIIPCYNEKKTIYRIINKILKLKKLNKEIIVVDDNSKDGSKEIIKKLEKKRLIKAIYHSKNLGKGSCIISAKRLIRGDIVIIQDADLEYYPRDIPKLITPIINNECLVVYGSRVLNKNYFENIQNFSQPWVRVVGNIFLTKLSNLINNQNLTDAHTCYKVFSAKLFSQIKLKENNFNFCPEITTKISNKKVKIKELSIKYKGREYQEGKKIKLIDGLRAIVALLKYKFFI